MAQYSAEQLRAIFRKPFDQSVWNAFVVDVFGANKVRVTPEEFKTEDGNAKGYFLGSIDTPDSYSIGLFGYEIKQGSVAHKKVGLRNLVKRFINQSWGAFDAAIVVFKSERGDEWRLSFICDIRELSTAPKRFTFVFGEPDNNYRTAVERFMELQGQKATFDNIRRAFSVEALGNDFFDTYRRLYADFVQLITGKRFVKKGGKWEEKDNFDSNEGLKAAFGGDDKAARDFVKKMFGRIVFLYFLQRKGWLAGNRNYMGDLFAGSAHKDDYLTRVLEPLFFGVLNEQPAHRTAEALELPGCAGIPYLNGGLFAQDEDDARVCRFPADQFERLFGFLDSYNFTIDENDPDDAEVGIDPEMLGRIFENLLEDNNDKGAFYTPKPIVDFICREALIAYLCEELSPERHGTVREFVESGDASALTPDLRALMSTRLRYVKICDPAIGSGAFPMGMVNLLSRLFLAIKPSADVTKMKRHIIEQSIYGVDLDKGAVDIARLRFWLAMVVEAAEPMPLPNLHFKIMQGNSLLEQYQGVDLSDLTDANKSIGEGEQLGLFDGSDDDRRQLIGDLHRFYGTSDHAERDQLLNDVKGNVLRQIADKEVELPQGTDPSANTEFFLWHTWFAEVFRPLPGDRHKPGGFDIVIGNPPFIQLQNNQGLLGKLYKPVGFESFASTGDIYALFYEQGWRLLRPGGHLCYISSNKWMRAGYGAKMRAWLSKNADTRLLLDFAGIQIFDNATVDSNILLIRRAPQHGSTRAVSCAKRDRSILKSLGAFVTQNAFDVEFPESDSWVILNSMELGIKRKIEAVGTPLKDWDINIYRGVLTGFNDAFIIDGPTREAILAACADDAERARTDALIRPILRGRDIKRYGYDWADTWLIYIPWHFPLHLDDSIKGASEVAEDAFRTQYPAVYNHLLQYKDKLSARNKAETGIRYEWYALQRWGANYWEDFQQPKIIFQEIVQESQFFLDIDHHFMCNDTCRIIAGKSLEYLTDILNSKLFFYAIKTFYGGGGLGEGVRMKHTFFEPFHCILEADAPLKSADQTVDEWVFAMYGLTAEEVAFIESQLGR